MAEALTTGEELAVEEFLNEVRNQEQHTQVQVSHSTAVKFLMARKFDVSRAIELFQAYKNTRIKEGIYNINPDEEPLRSELLSGKFTVLPGRDAKGAALALFTARLHRPDSTSHKAVLQAIIYQLDKAIESIETQRDGLIFIYDMTSSTYGNFDYELCVKILNLLKVCTVKAHELVGHIPMESLPEHLGGSSNYSHIAWIQACVNSGHSELEGGASDGDCVGNLLRSYSLQQSSSKADTTTGDGLNSNTGDDNSCATNANLHNHYHGQGRTSTEVEPPQQPRHRRGDCQHWNGSVVMQGPGVTGASTGGAGTAEARREKRDSVRGDLNRNGNERSRHPPPQSDTPPDTPLHHKHVGSPGRTDEAEVSGQEDEGGLGVPPLPQKSSRPTPWQNATPPSSSPGPDTELSVHMPELGGMDVTELVQYVKKKKKKGIYQEYEEIRKELPSGSFDYSKKPYNQVKNRYSDVLCLDHSRVKLYPLSDDDETSDYINASFMDGYKRSNAYIATQGPLPKTYCDFWRMVWEQMVLVIVMTTRVIERGRVKCGQYWPLDVGCTEQYGPFAVSNAHIEMFQDFKLSHLELCNSRTGERRDVAHFQYMSWPDFGVPKSASAMLDFRAQVKQHQETAFRAMSTHWTGPPGGPPVVVHCSAGIGRTGTFCTLDICLSRLEDIGTVDVRETVRRMRSQRAFSIQTWDQYYLCYTAVLEYAQRRALLAPVQWSDTDLETDSD